MLVLVAYSSYARVNLQYHTSLWGKELGETGLVAGLPKLCLVFLNLVLNSKS
jgi:hypothetical protein